jgi:ABC-type phosphate transport system substrate-binding protein
VKRSLLRRGLAAVGTLSLAATMAVGLAPSAHAAPLQTQIVFGGSDTIQNVMDPITADALATYNAAHPGATIGIFNMHAAVNSGQPDLTYTVPADPNCVSQEKYTTNAVPPAGFFSAPNGSGAGVAALVAAEAGNFPSTGAGTGCIDVARSSNGPKGHATDGSANLEFYAFALDAVTWASPSLQAPAGLTLLQLQDIYNCTFTNWSQVGGGGGQIQRYMPQAGSGTAKFFQSNVLGFDPTTFSGPSCPAVINTQLDHGGKPLEENNGGELDAAHYQQAILPYSIGQWTYQANNHVNPTIDARNGVRVGGFIIAANPSINYQGWDAPDGVWQPNAVTPVNPGAPINENQTPQNTASPTFPGIRYVFNVLDNVGPTYSIAQQLVGFNNVPSGTLSPVCNGSEIGNISSFGFAPLTATGGTVAQNAAGATCRFFPET